MKKIFLIAIAALACLSSCTKNNLPAPDAKKAGSAASGKAIIFTITNTFVAGYYHAATGHTVAAYWVNNTMYRLVNDSTVNSQARAIFVSGSDVYVAGFIATSAGNKAACWKNGALLVIDNGSVSDAFGITVVGTDVYVVGYRNYLRTTQQAVLWKNGVANYLNGPAIYANRPTTASEAIGITADGSDIYVCGAVQKELYYYNQKTYVPTYWKNGVATALRDTGSHGHARGIAIYRGVVFIAGQWQTNDDPREYAAYWVNTAEHALLTSGYVSAEVNHLVMNGSTIYTLGYETEVTGNLYTRSVFWTGSNENIISAVHLGDETNSGGVSYYNSSLFYASNWSSDGIIWKNGAQYQTVSHKGIINDLFVRGVN